MADRTYEQNAETNVTPLVDRWGLLAEIETFIQEELGQLPNFTAATTATLIDGELKRAKLSEVAALVPDWERIKSVRLYGSAHGDRYMSIVLRGSHLAPFYKDGELRGHLTSERESEAVGWKQLIERKVQDANDAADRAESKRLETTGPQRQSFSHWWQEHHRTLFAGLIIGVIGAVVGAVVTVLLT